MCPSAPRVCSEPGGQMPVLSLSLDLIGGSELFGQRVIVNLGSLSRRAWHCTTIFIHLFILFFSFMGPFHGQWGLASIFVMCCVQGTEGCARVCTNLRNLTVEQSAEWASQIGRSSESKKKLSVCFVRNQHGFIFLDGLLPVSYPLSP